MHGHWLGVARLCWMQLGCRKKNGLGVENTQCNSGGEIESDVFIVHAFIVRKK